MTPVTSRISYRQKHRFSLRSRFGKGRSEKQVDVELGLKNGVKRQYQIQPLGSDDIPKEWYL